MLKVSTNRFEENVIVAIQFHLIQGLGMRQQTSSRSISSRLVLLLSAAGLAACAAQDGALDGGQPSGQDASADLAAAYPSVACGECFPFERLPDPLKQRASDLLLAALDAEALYTLAAELKPMSSGFVSLKYRADQPEPPQLSELRTIFEQWRCTDEVSAALQIFNQVYAGERYAEGAVFHRLRFAGTLSRYPTLFADIGAKPPWTPIEVVDAVDADATTRRFRAYGYLFGYPEYAVEFFVMAVEHERKTGMFVERDFIQIPTYVADTGRFVYAVPKGHVENAEDRALKQAAAQVLARYRALRDRYIGPDKAGVLGLVREWYGDGAGRCSPRLASSRP